MTGTLTRLLALTIFVAALLAPVKHMVVNSGSGTGSGHAALVIVLLEDHCVVKTRQARDDHALPVRAPVPCLVAILHTREVPVNPLVANKAFAPRAVSQLIGRSTHPPHAPPIIA